MNSTGRVLIFLEQLLPASETFVKAQGEMLRWDVLFCGLYPAEPTLELERPIVRLVDSRSWLAMKRVGLYRHTRIAPSFHKRLATWGAHLLHAHFAPNGLLAMPLAETLNIPLVVTLHGYDVATHFAPAHLYRPLWQRAKKFICVSEALKERAIATGFPEDKLRVHYIGIDPRLFPQRDPVEEDPNVVLFIGRLVEKKGGLHLLEAMNRLRTKHPHVRVVLAGDGPLRASLEQKAGDFNLNATFLGMQSHDQIRALLRTAAVLCAPSMTAANGDSEGLPIALLEAQSTGVPVVSYRHGGIPEAVIDGVTAFLAPERDVDQLAVYLNNLLSDREQRMKMGDAGARNVRSRFDLQAQTKLLERIYQDIVARASGSAR